MADRWGSGRRRPEPHPCSVFLRAINEVDPTPAGSRFGTCSQSSTQNEPAPFRRAPALLSRLPQDDLDAMVLKLAHAGRRGYERIGVAEALDVDRGLRHTAANQFCFHGARATATSPGCK